MTPAIAARVIGAAADLALVLDSEGIIQDLSLGDLGVSRALCEPWIGQRWLDTVATDSRNKVELLLKEARASRGALVRGREINQRVKGNADVPLRFSAVRLHERGRILAIGRDLRALSNLQQQLVGAQQSMEREYSRLRHAETRYRMLFQIASEGVLIVDAATMKVTECNPVASRLLQDTAPRLAGRTLSTLFTPESWNEVRELLGSAQLAVGAAPIIAQLAHDQSDVQVAASVFRQGGSSLFLLRISGQGGSPTEANPRDSQILEVIESLPDAFVMIDTDRRVLSANAAFVEMAQLAGEPQVRGEPLDRWLGRAGGDLNILLANLREHGSVRNFGTVIRGEYGLTEQVDVSAVAAMESGRACYGLVVRQASSPFSLDTGGSPVLPRSVEQLTALVGRVALKEIVRETTDLIERLCIEAALKVSGDNRASAAQILGLSRQSLYSKLRRHDLGGDDDAEGQA